LDHPDVRAGRIHTGFIDEHASELLTSDDPPLEALAAAAAATPAVVFAPAGREGSSPSLDPWQAIRGWGR